MKLLAVDTATEACSVAVWQDGAVLQRYEVVGRDHTQRLLPMVQALLAEAGLRFGQLDGLVAGVGPGSFAGVRIAVSFIKGLALARELPTVGVSSLAILAQGAVRRQGAARLLAAIDARMGEVYFGAYAADAQGLVQPLQPAVVAAPAAVRLDAAADANQPWQAVGSGWGSYEVQLRAAIGACIAHCDGAALPEARDALTLALPQFKAGLADAADKLLPIYLRNRVALTLTEQAQLRAKNSGL